MTFFSNPFSLHDGILTVWPSPLTWRHMIFESYLSVFTLFQQYFNSTLMRSERQTDSIKNLYRRKPARHLIQNVGNTKTSSESFSYIRNKIRHFLPVQTKGPTQVSFNNQPKTVCFSTLSSAMCA